MKKVCKYCRGTGKLTKKMYDKIVRERFKEAQKGEHGYGVRTGQAYSVKCTIWLPMRSSPLSDLKKTTYYCDKCDAMANVVKR